MQYQYDCQRSSDIHEDYKKETVVNKAEIDRQLREIEKLRTEIREISNKLLLEQHERRKLHNTVEDMKGKIRVYCRIRPLNDYEREIQSVECLQVLDEFTVS